MLRFRFKHSVPPGGKWFYTIPGTLVYFESYEAYHELERKVRQYYAVNKIEVPANLTELIENYICGVVTPGFCEGEDLRLGRRVRPLTFFEAVEKTEQFYRGRSRRLVTVKEAVDRATLCQRCAENSLGLCTSCNGLRDLARRFVGGRKLAQDAWLGVCGVYRLPLNALVHTMVEAADVLDAVPVTCWTRTVKGVAV